VVVGILVLEQEALEVVVLGVMVVGHLRLERQIQVAAVEQVVMLQMVLLAVLA
jgi:hypothetical protein